MNDIPAEQTWMVLAELLTNLRKRDVQIDPKINKELSLAKTTINFYKVNPADPERMNEIKRINEFLNNVQEKLLDLAELEGKDYKDQWLEKLIKVSRGEKLYNVPDKKSKFVVGAPAGFSMVRVTFKTPIHEERVQEIAEYNNVIIEFQTDHLVVIYGDKENIQNSLKEIASFFTEQVE